LFRIKLKTVARPLKIFYAKKEVETAMGGLMVLSRKTMGIKLIPRKAPTQPIDRVKGGFHGCNYH